MLDEVMKRSLISQTPYTVMSCNVLQKQKAVMEEVFIHTITDENKYDLGVRFY